MADTEDDDPEVPAPVVTAAGPAVEAPLNPNDPAATVPPAPSKPSSPSYDIDSMLISPEKKAALQKQFLDIREREAASSSRNAGETISRLDRDQKRMEDAYNATGIEPSSILNSQWDSDQQTKKYSTDPVAAFGSAGSVFAFLASAFTGAPMETALNAGAAAINAVHDQDTKAYEKAYKGWKDNTDLALKRHEIQRQAFNDATNLMNSDINAGRTKREMSLIQFGDEKGLALAQAGMDKELTDYFEAKDKAAVATATARDEMELQHAKTMMLKSDPDWQSGDPTRKVAAVRRLQDAWAAGGSAKLKFDAVKYQIDQFDKEHPNATYEERQAAISDSTEAANSGKGRKPSATDAEIERRTEEYVASGMSQTEANNKARSEVKQSNTTKSQAIREIVEQSKADVAAGKPGAAVKTLEQATAEYNRQTAAPSGNRLDDINKQIDMYDNGIKGIDRTLALINKHVGAVGAAGYVTRLGERVSNIVDSNATDRSQIAHDIQYLQTIAPRLMLDASSRGLKAEADKINQIVGGLNLGDTTANVKRALTEVRDLWAKMQADNLARAQGRPNQGGLSGTTGGVTPPPATATKPWLKDPVVAPASP